MRCSSRSSPPRRSSMSPEPTTKVLETERLILRRLSVDDGGFILRLVNDPLWLRFIGDKGVKTLEDARNYILTGPMDMYARLGFGLYLTERKSDAAPLGICGLIRRDALKDVAVEVVPGQRQQIVDSLLRYAERTSHAHCGQFARFDDAIDRHGRHAHEIGDFLNCQEPRRGE